MILSLLFIFPILIISSCVTPYITRKTESFGVAIPKNYYDHPTITAYRKKYATLSLLFGFLLMATLFGLTYLWEENTWFIAFTVGLFIYMIGTFFIYLHFHKKMKQMKEKEKWYEGKREALSIDMNFYKQKLTYSNWWFLIPFGISITTFVLTVLNMDLFPDPLPMQYDLEGNVTRWADKSLWTLISFPLLQLFLTGLFLFVNIIIQRSKQQLESANPEQSVRQNIIFRHRWSLFTIVSGTLMVALFTITQLSFVIRINDRLLFSLILIMTGIIVIGAITISLTTGQGGSRIQVANGSDGQVINRDDDKYWKLGIFYFNPNDPALFVEKRFGGGWTNNLARPASWIMLVVIILIPILIAILTE